MGFVVFFFVSWLFISIYSTIKKRLSIVENTFVFLIILIISINYSWIVIEELKFVSVSKNRLDYASFLLNRSINIPMLIIIHLNLLQWCKTLVMKTVVILSTVAILTGLSIFANHMNMSKYEHWNFAFDAIFFMFLSLIAILLYKLYAKVTLNAVDYS
ncbi:hypothetical protein [Neobacillus sp. D3-1R]|uniref:hypothetical protein n=1 Tax=Neobacillus sp. D3-1R TaxID=3445778 RepID=UPI003F9FD937